MDPEYKHKKPGYFLMGIPAWWTVDKLPKQIRDQVTKFTGTYEKKNGLLVYGPPGFGKTSFVAALGFWEGVGGHYARFQDFEELMVEIKGTWKKNPDRTTADIIEGMMEPDVLILDDIGKSYNPTATEILSTIINGRVNQIKKTLCTTNCELDKPEGIEAFRKACDGRVLERFTNCDINAATWGRNLRRDSETT